MSKRNIGSYIMLVIALLMYGAAVLLELYWPIHNVHLTDTALCVLTAFTAFASIWFAGYFLLFSAFRGRYPEALLNARRRPIAKSIIAAIILILAFGAISTSAQLAWCECASIVISIAYTAFLLIQSYTVDKSLNLNRYISDLISQLVDDKNNSLLSPDNEKTLSRINMIYSECLTRKEHYTCISIQAQLSRLFIAHVESGSKLAISGNVDGQKLEKELNDLLNAMKLQILEIDDTEPHHFIGQVFGFHIDNLLACAKADRFTLFQHYFDELLSIAALLSGQSQQSVKECCMFAAKTVMTDCSQLKNDSYVDYCVSSALTVSRATYAIYKKGASTGWILFFADAFCSLKGDYDNATATIFKAFIECSENEARITGTLNNSVQYHILVFRRIIELNNSECLTSYLTFLLDSLRYIGADDAWVSCIFFLSDMLEQEDGETWESQIDELRINASVHSITSGSETPQIYVTDYAKRISSKELSDDSLDRICRDLQKPLYICTRLNENGPLQYFCDAASQAFLACQQKQKNMQKSLLQVFFQPMRYASEIKQVVAFELLTDQLNQTIRDADKEMLLSEDVCKTFLDEYFALCTKLSEKRYQPFFNQATRYFSNLYSGGDEIGFLLKNSDLREFYYDSWLDVGIRCAEEGNEEGIRQVSGILGWGLADAMKRRNNTEAEYILKTAIAFNGIVSQFDLGKNTEIFLLTLFTVIGAYACAHRSCFNIRRKVVDYLSKKDMKLVNLASDIRFTPGCEWPSLFDDKIEEYPKQLLDEVRKRKNAEPRK